MSIYQKRKSELRHEDIEISKNRSVQLKKQKEVAAIFKDFRRRPDEENGTTGEPALDELLDKIFHEEL